MSLMRRGGRHQPRRMHLSPSADLCETIPFKHIEMRTTVEDGDPLRWRGTTRWTQPLWPGKFEGFSNLSRNARVHPTHIKHTHHLTSSVVATSVVEDHEDEGWPQKGVLLGRIKQVISVTVFVVILTRVIRWCSASQSRQDTAGGNPNARV